MDCETKLWLVVVIFLSATSLQQHCVVGHPQVPCLFIFGDSLSDCGNNNNLTTDAKVNYLPYGIDFPAGPTGRFTNGRTSVDVLTQLLGIEEFIPPFANTCGSDILKGVNYASGSAGILNETGKHLGENINLGLQVQHHKVIVSQITKKLGCADKAQQYLNKCLYYVNIGSNDYLNNYFLPEHYPSSRKFSPDQYAAALAQEYSTNLKELYALGGRKFSLIGLSHLGCVPQEIHVHGKNGSGCVEEESKTPVIFNDKAKAVVDRFNQELAGAKFIFINSAVGAIDPTNVPDICCKVGLNGQCIPNNEPCKDRRQFLFFDAFHPSEMTNLFTAKCAYNATVPGYAHPMDISHLVKS